MLTLAKAYALLTERWPGRSFCIGMTAWHHKHAPVNLEITWSVYDAEGHEHYEGPTLENALEQSLGCDADLAGVDQRLEWFRDGSGYVLHGPLTQEKPS